MGNRAEDSAGGIGTVHAYSSITQYIDHVGRYLKLLYNHVTTYACPVSDIRVHWAKMSVKRQLGNAKMRARTISFSELRDALTRFVGTEDESSTFHFLSLLAWLGCFRLGQLLPSDPAELPKTMQIAHISAAQDGLSVVVQVHCSKTNRFRERFRTIRIFGSSDPCLCIVSAFSRVSAMCARLGIGLNSPLASLHPRFSTFDGFLQALQRLIPAEPDTQYERGKLTGHSPRRSFTKAALEAGVPLPAVMLFGDWSHEDSVLSSYAVGAVLASVSLVPRPAGLQQGSQADSHGAIFIIPADLRVPAARQAGPVPAPFNPAPRAAVGQSVVQRSSALQSTAAVLLRSGFVLADAAPVQRQQELVLPPAMDGALLVRNRPLANLRDTLARADGLLMQAVPDCDPVSKRARVGQSSQNALARADSSLAAAASLLFRK